MLRYFTLVSEVRSLRNISLQSFINLAYLADYNSVRVFVNLAICTAMEPQLKVVYKFDLIFLIFSRNKAASPTSLMIKI